MKLIPKTAKYSLCTALAVQNRAKGEYRERRLYTIVWFFFSNRENRNMRQEVTALSSKPAKNQLLRLTDYRGVKGLVNHIAKEICKQQCWSQGDVEL